ncbi:MAG: hypothetical protein AAF591_05920 [Verrucomicrobiota bacterium]
MAKKKFMRIPNGIMNRGSVALMLTCTLLASCDRQNAITLEDQNEIIEAAIRLAFENIGDARSAHPKESKVAVLLAGFPYDTIPNEAAGRVLYTRDREFVDQQKAKQKPFGGLFISFRDPRPKAPISVGISNFETFWDSDQKKLKNAHATSLLVNFTFDGVRWNSDIRTRAVE